jgi:predicted unusual protein kinase regulating ubiquinone biosynthesis (AarF/ABC1/UbiB family)
LEKIEQRIEDKKEIEDTITTEDAVSKTMAAASKISKFYLLSVLWKLAPILFNLRRDRREWVRKEGRNIDTKKYTKHAEKTLATFISLGPSYIKLGQWLSTRTDVLPQPYLEVLAKLQDDFRERDRKN